MKILAIGDPHGDLNKLRRIPKEDIDLILITGDLGDAKIIRKMFFENVERRKKGLPEKKFPKSLKIKGQKEIYTSSIKVLEYLSKFATIYTIFGNVEPTNQSLRKKSKELGVKLPSITDKISLMKNVKLINNKLIAKQGVKIGGLAYYSDFRVTKEFFSGDLASLKKAEISTKKARLILNKFKQLDILVCHQPPYGILDKVTAKFAPKHTQGKHAGSKLILDYIKRHKPRYVFCGHIHEGKGEAKIGRTEIYNLGVCGYKIIKI